MAKTLLIVDDEAAVTFALDGFFRQKGYDVLKAFYGDQALELIKAKRPAAVILDLQLPGLNGLEVLERMRVLSPETKALVITGFSDQYQAQLGRLKEVKVLVKPVSLTDLTREVQQLLEGSAPAVGAPAAASKTARLLFVEGSRENYERVLKPYFESQDRAVRCQTGLATGADEALQLAAELKPQLIVLDGSRLPVGTDAGNLAARLTGAVEPPPEVILVEIPSTDYQIGAKPDARLERLEKSVLAAARKKQLVPHATQ